MCSSGPVASRRSRWGPAPTYVHDVPFRHTASTAGDAPGPGCDVGRNSHFRMMHGGLPIRSISRAGQRRRREGDGTGPDRSPRGKGYQFGPVPPRPPVAGGRLADGRVGRSTGRGRGRQAVEGLGDRGVYRDAHGRDEGLRRAGDRMRLSTTSCVRRPAARSATADDDRRCDRGGSDGAPGGVDDRDRGSVIGDGRVGVGGHGSLSRRREPAEWALDLGCTVDDKRSTERDVPWSIRPRQSPPVRRRDGSGQGLRRVCPGGRP